jgi:hypothetical protein
MQRRVEKDSWIHSIVSASNSFKLISENFLASSALLIVSSNSTIGPIRLTLKFLMISGEIGRSMGIEDSEWPQFQTHSWRFDCARKIIRGSRVMSLAAKTNRMVWWFSRESPGIWLGHFADKWQIELPISIWSKELQRIIVTDLGFVASGQLQSTAQELDIHRRSADAGFAEEPGNSGPHSHLYDADPRLLIFFPRQPLPDFSQTEIPLAGNLIVRRQHTISSIFASTISLPSLSSPGLSGRGDSPPFQKLISLSVRSDRWKSLCHVMKGYLTPLRKSLPTLDTSDTPGVMAQ